MSSDTCTEEDVFACHCEDDLKASEMKLTFNFFVGYGYRYLGTHGMVVVCTCSTDISFCTQEHAMLEAE